MTSASPPSCSVAHELIHLAECPITVIPERVVDRHASTTQVGAAS
jgi:hypothetical protein